MTKLPIGMLPRGLTRDQAAAYCGCETTDAFDGWVRRGIVPGPMAGTRRWDRKAIDRALDRLSGCLPLRLLGSRGRSGRPSMRTERRSTTAAKRCAFGYTAACMG